MSGDHVRQPRALASEPTRTIDTPYLTASEAAIYLRYKNARTLYKAIEYGIDIPFVRRGQRMLFHRDHLDQWLAGKPRLELLKEARSRKQIG